MSRYRLENVAQRYRESRTGRTVEALRVPHLEVRADEILAVVGPNGSGKSTLLEILAFLRRPEEGRILLDGRDVWAEGGWLAARRRCPILLQKTVLLKTTVLQNVMYGLRVRGLSHREARRRAEAVLAQVGLEALANRGHRELSGGERQQVGLARLLVLEPDVLLLDEPTAHVDEPSERLIEQIIRDLHARTGMTVVVASHSLRQAAALAQRVIALAGGRILPTPPELSLHGTLSMEGDAFVFRGEDGAVVRFGAEALNPQHRAALSQADARSSPKADPGSGASQ